MKRILSGILAAVTLLIFVACGGSSDNSAQSNNQTGSSAMNVAGTRFRLDALVSNGVPMEFEVLETLLNDSIVTYWFYPDGAMNVSTGTGANMRHGGRGSFEQNGSLVNITLPNGEERLGSLDGETLTIHFSDDDNVITFFMEFLDIMDLDAAPPGGPPAN